MSMGAPGARGTGGGPSVKESRLGKMLKKTLQYSKKNYVIIYCIYISYIYIYI